MQFTHTEPTSHPRDKVFTTHRDRLVELVPYLDTVESVVLQSRADHADGKAILQHRWKGTPAALPLLLRPMVPPQLLQWEDRTTWDRAGWAATWTIEIPSLGPALWVRGTNRFTETAKGCTVRVDGELSFHPERMPQVNFPPAMVPMLERFAVGMIVPMIEQSGRAVARLLDAG